MATTTTYKGKGLECPKFLGKDEDYQVWITKFEAYAKVKGFYMVMAGTDIPPLANQATKTAPELKVEEKNDTGTVPCFWQWTVPERRSRWSLLRRRWS